jgi:dTDP-4-dehydrorhamnose reductase
MTILITGGKTSLSEELKKNYHKFLIPDVDELDLTNEQSVKDFFLKNTFDCIIHNFSLMNVRECEENKSKAELINVKSTKILIDIINQINPNLKFFHLSTPCIFDGKQGMYDESSVPKPVNFYGLTRMSSEQIVQKLQNYCIIRTNYVSKQKWPHEKAFVDRFGTYLFSEQVAKGLLEILEENISGIIHLCGDKKISMYELAKITTPDIQPITIDDYSGPKLNLDMSLDSKKWKKYSLEY